MIGSNQLVINQATMIEALQEYFTKRMPSTPIVVKSVEQTKGNSGGYGGGATFTVETMTEETQEPKS